MLVMGSNVTCSIQSRHKIVYNDTGAHFTSAFSYLWENYVMIFYEIVIP